MRARKHNIVFVWMLSLCVVWFVFSLVYNISHHHSIICWRLHLWFCTHIYLYMRYGASHYITFAKRANHTTQQQQRNTHTRSQVDPTHDRVIISSLSHSYSILTYFRSSAMRKCCTESASNNIIIYGSSLAPSYICCARGACVSDARCMYIKERV